MAFKLGKLQYGKIIKTEMGGGRNHYKGKDYAFITLELAKGKVITIGLVYGGDPPERWAMFRLKLLEQLGGCFKHLVMNVFGSDAHYGKALRIRKVKVIGSDCPAFYALC